jgi:hypothetical protein
MTLTVTCVKFHHETGELIHCAVRKARSKVCLDSGPSTGPVDCVPAKDLLSIAVANPCVHIVIVEDLYIHVSKKTAGRAVCIVKEHLPCHE